MLKSSDRQIIHAINTLVSAKPGILAELEQKYEGDWRRAWRSGADIVRALSRTVPPLSRKSLDPEKEWARLEKLGIQLLTIRDQGYPRMLKHIPDPPFVLYIRGDEKVLNDDCFAVVGTRALTDYGRRATPEIVPDIARGGFTVVSGLAAGIDTLAHRAALDAGGRSIAVLGCGVDDPTIFPQQNLKLAHKILETGGAVVSEYAPGTHGNKISFPQRNRIISGLSKGVLVVEADVQSGALITAHHAIEQNRDLFCVPGQIYAKYSQGTNFMIKKGAKLVASAADILEEYDIELDKQPRIIKGDNPTEDKILAVLASEPLTGDDIIRQTGLETSQVNVALVLMELNKKIKSLGRNRFVLYS